MAHRLIELLKVRNEQRKRPRAHGAPRDRQEAKREGVTDHHVGTDTKDGGVRRRHQYHHEWCELRLQCPGGELRLVEMTRETAEVPRLPILQSKRLDLGDRSDILDKDVCDVRRIL